MLGVVACIWLGLVPLSTGTSLYSGDPSALYEDMLVRDLYKRLSDLAENQYIDDQGWVDDIALESRESGRADPRDQEYLEENSPNSNGFQYISGGAGEGKQHLKPEGTQKNTQEVKSDETLPFYCHPPNPCPKGYTAKAGCHEFIEDAAEFQQEWILKMQKKGMCSCDEEHMFKCPDPKNGDDSHQNFEMDKVLDQLLNGVSNNNPYISNELPKREFLVAKKAPIVKRDTDQIDRLLEEMKAQNEHHDNPYLQDVQIRRVAKKG